MEAVSKQFCYLIIFVMSSSAFRDIYHLKRPLCLKTAKLQPEAQDHMRFRPNILNYKKQLTHEPQKFTSVLLSGGGCVSCL